MRRIFHLHPAPEFLAWLEGRGMYRDSQPAMLDGPLRRELMSKAEELLSC